jgi:hypothetical protein
MLIGELVTSGRRSQMIPILLKSGSLLFGLSEKGIKLVRLEVGAEQIRIGTAEHSMLPAVVGNPLNPGSMKDTI